MKASSKKLAFCVCGHQIEESHHLLFDINFVEVCCC